jgi:hypothetical protein
MAFEVNTLFLLTIDVEAILGLLLLLVWVQNTRVQAVAWWASAHLMRATSVMLYGLYGSVPDLISIDLANVILSPCPKSHGTVRAHSTAAYRCRIADRGRRRLAARLPAAGRPRGRRGQLSSMTSHHTLPPRMILARRREPLVSRWPAIVLFATHGAMFICARRSTLRMAVKATTSWQAPGSTC